MKSPVTSISNAALRARLRDSATLGDEQNRPRLTPLTAKRASLAATARSHAATSWQPAAVAMPCTRAITGTGRRWIVSIMRAHCANRRLVVAERRLGAHLLQVVAGAERLALGGDDDDARAVVAGDGVELGLQRRRACRCSAR